MRNYSTCNVDRPTHAKLKSLARQRQISIRRLLEKMTEEEVRVVGLLGDADGCVLFLQDLQKKIRALEIVKEVDRID